MPVLGIDLGQTVGWFLGEAVGPCRWGSFPLATTTDLGRWLKSSDEFWQAILPEADAMAIEQPFLGASYYPARKLISLLGHAYWHAGYVGLTHNAIMEVPVSTGKHTLTGHGNADKDQMIAAAAADGYEDMDEHAADAYGIWKVYVFGRREKISKPKARNGKGKSILTPEIVELPLDAPGVSGWKVEIST